MFLESPDSQQEHGLSISSVTDAGVCHFVSCHFFLVFSHYGVVCRSVVSTRMIAYQTWRCGLVASVCHSFATTLSYSSVSWWICRSYQDTGIAVIVVIVDIAVRVCHPCHNSALRFDYRKFCNLMLATKKFISIQLSMLLSVYIRSIVVDIYFTTKIFSKYFSIDIDLRSSLLRSSLFSPFYGIPGTMLS